jgi:hypothetical protein
VSAGRGFPRTPDNQRRSHQRLVDREIRRRGGIDIPAPSYKHNVMSGEAGFIQTYANTRTVWHVHHRINLLGRSTADSQKLNDRGFGHMGRHPMSFISGFTGEYKTAQVSETLPILYSYRLVSTVGCETRFDLLPVAYH